MTKTVKYYVERKIKEAAMPKRAALEKKLKEAKDAAPEVSDMDKEIYASKEYKAVDAFIRKWAKAHGAKISYGYRGEFLMYTNLDISYDAVDEAQRELDDYVAKVNNMVEEALVAMELSKSKADLDEIIAQAVASL